MQAPNKNPNQTWQKFIGMLRNNLGMKLLSVMLAIALWTLVVYSDDSITRSRTFSDLSVLLTGQTALSDNYLALVKNPLEDLDDVSVELEVPQAQYSRVSANHVRVRLDLSNVRNVGTQLVPLTVTSTYGRVKNVYPSAVEVEIEALDARSVPMNATITGRSNDNRWYNIRTMNPDTITISGASSIVRNIAMGRVTVDVSGMSETGTRAYPYQLFDYSGNEIPQELVTRSASSVSATVDIYPTKELPVNNALESVLLGSIAEGYEVESVAISPSTITVAASQDLLDDLDSLAIEPIVAENVNQTFTLRTSISKLNGIRYFSAEQVYVTVNVREREETISFADIPVKLINVPAHLAVTAQPAPISVQVSGEYSDIVNLSEGMLQVTADLSQAVPGSGTYPIQISVPGRPYLTFNLSTPEVSLTLRSRDTSSATH